MKTCDSLIFNPDAIVLAESIKGKMDSNNCFHVAEHLEEELVLPSSKGFDAVKANVVFGVLLQCRWTPSLVRRKACTCRTESLEPLRVPVSTCGV